MRVGAALNGEKVDVELPTFETWVSQAEAQIKAHRSMNEIIGSLRYFGCPDPDTVYKEARERLGTCKEILK